MADTLCNASAQGNLPKVLLLLQSGTDVNGLSSHNMTALQVVKLGNDLLVEVLLEAGSDPNVRDPFCGLTVTHDAAREGFIDAVRVLVNHGADLNLVDKKGNLPLHLAAREGHLNVVQLLIGHTANPHTPNSEGRTAGQLAQLHGKVATAQYIEDYLSAH